MKTKKNHQAQHAQNDNSELIDAILSILARLSIKVWVVILTALVLIVGAVWLFDRLTADNSVGITTDQRINITPAQIESIRQIGQWEFLSISDEEMVDTVDRGFLKDKELARIYYGTLRLGIDLEKVDDHWLQVDDSVVVATLPPIQLLDRNFIDEARTRSFFESGSWTAQDREQLYQRAHRKMVKRCMSKQNIAQAQENARQQFTQLLRAMGFDNVKVEFQE